MNEELRTLANRAQWAQDWFPLGGYIRQLCDIVAKLEERIEKLEPETTSFGYSADEGDGIGTCSVQEKAKALALEGLTTDGDSHKQWFLEEILKTLSCDLKDPVECTWEPGTVP